MAEENSGWEISLLSALSSSLLLSNSFCMKSVFEKLRFRDGLVWTVGLIVGIELPFEIPPA